MEFNPNPEQLLKDQQAIVMYFGKGKDKTGDSREERDLTKDDSREERDLTKDNKDEEDETMDTDENGCD